MKTKFEDCVLGFYSPVVHLLIEEALEAGEALELLIAEGRDWCVTDHAMADSIYSDSWYWNLNIREAELVLKKCERELFKQMFKESFLPFSLVALILFVGVTL